MAIIDSVRKLAEKVGADTNGRTIADQLNIINQKLDNTQPGSRDISEAVSKFADKEDGTAILVTKTVTENKTYKASDDGASGYSSVTVNVAAPTPETFEVEFIIDSVTGGLSATKTYAQTLTAIQNNNIIDFTLDAPFSCIYGGCFIFSNPVTEKDDMYFFVSPDSPTSRDETGTIIHYEGIIWTETGITIKSYIYSPD